MDYDQPLRWEHEDGRTGTEISQMPLGGRVFFYDERGPVGRFDDAVEARWWCLLKMEPATERTMRFRAVRLVDSDGGFHYLLPGFPGVMDCDTAHPCEWRFPCVLVDAMCQAIFEAVGS